MVVRSFPQGVKIKIGQIIKLGKAEYEIIEMNNGQQNYDFFFEED